MILNKFNLALLIITTSMIFLKADCIVAIDISQGLSLVCFVTSSVVVFHFSVSTRSCWRLFTSNSSLAAVCRRKFKQIYDAFIFNKELRIVTFNLWKVSHCINKKVC